MREHHDDATARDPTRAWPRRGRGCAGLADHLGLPVWLVRVAFVVLALAGGIGLVLYAAFWAVLPLARDEDDDAADPDAARGTDLTRLLALAALVLGVGLLLLAFGVDVLGGAVVPVVAALVGAALVWQQADADQRSEWSATAARAARQTAGSTAQAGRWRVVAGVGLVVLGLIGVLVSRSGPAAAAQALATAVCSSAAPRWSSSRGSTGAGVSRPSSVGPASARRSAPRWPPTCTTRCCRRSP